MEQNNIKIFNFIAENKFDDFFNFIKKNKDNIDLDIYDNKNIYIIQYIINFNKYLILQK